MLATMLPLAGHSRSFQRTAHAADCTTEQRRRDRNRRALFTTLTSAAAKAVSMIAVLLTVPPVLQYLGAERYGLWMTLTSALAMLTFSDLGLSNGLLSELSIACGRDDRERAAGLVASAFFILSAIGVVLFLTFLLIVPHLPWAKILNLSPGAGEHDATDVMVVLTVSLAIGLPVGIVHKIHLASQQGFIYDLWLILGTIISAVLVITSVHYRSGLPWLVGCVSIAPLLTSIVAWVYFATRRHHWSLPRLSRFSTSVAARLLRTGVQYCILSLLMTLGLYIDNLVVGRVLGYEAVTALAIPARIMGLLQGVTTMVCLPMWSANAEAIARGDAPWVRKSLMFLTTTNVGLNLLLSGIVLLGGRVLFSLWLGESFIYDGRIVSLLCLNAVLFSLTGPAFALLNSTQRVLSQIVMYAVFCAAAIGFKLHLVHVAGVYGVLLGQILAYVLFIVIPLWVTVYLMFTREELGWAFSKSPSAAC